MLWEVTQGSQAAGEECHVEILLAQFEIKDDGRFKACIVSRQAYRVPEGTLKDPFKSRRDGSGFGDARGCYCLYCGEGDVMVVACFSFYPSFARRES